MAQLNVEIDDNLIKRVKMACIEDGTNLKKWVTAALELALDFDELAIARCRELGWVPGFGVEEKDDTSFNPVEIIDEPTHGPSSQSERVKKAH